VPAGSSRRFRPDSERLNDPGTFTAFIGYDWTSLAKEQAFYYVRVPEIPTPRWTAYDAKRFGTKLDEKIPMQLQERACTSPIWYAPK